MVKIKSFLKTLIPPIFLVLLKFNKVKYGWFGNYKTWEKASKRAKGYDSEIILNKVKSSLIKVKNGQAVFERDSVIFKEKDYSFPLLTSLLHIANLNNQKLKVLDFGGSLGSSYYQCKEMLQNIDLMSWVVIEQKNFVASGKKEFETAPLYFEYDMASAIKKFGKPSILIISSTLEYIENPDNVIANIISYNIDYICFDKTPFWNFKDIITIQKVPPKIYDASYPCWIFNEDNFIKKFNKYYNIAFRTNLNGFMIHDKQVIKKAILFKKK